MATYVNDLRLKEIATGDESGTWGTSTNTNLELIGEALGYGTQEVFSSDADATTTIADGASDPARAMYFKITSGVSLTATRTCTIAPNTVSRVMFIENATTGSQSITISQGSGANVTIATGRTAVVYLDGAGSGAAVVDALALVDPGVTDTLAEVLVAGNTSGGTNIELTTTDKVQFRDTAIYINSSADGQLDIVADTEVQIAATTIDVNGTLAFDSLKGTGATTVTNILDEDNMGSDSATALATQQSIKAYVDSQVGTVDTLAEILANGNTTGGTDIAVGTGDDITFADSSKAIFGAGSDLQIYHNGSHSIISDVGTGNLKLGGTGLELMNGALSEYYLAAIENAGVYLYYDNAAKLTTTATGIDVTGSVTATGGSTFASSVEITNGTLNLSPTGTANAVINAGASMFINIDSDNNSAGESFYISRDANNTSGARVAKFDAIGDISFYEDTGTTPKFFWDASAESLGIGTSSPDSPLEIQAATNSSSDTTYLKLFNAGENVGHIDFENGNGSLARITGTKEGSGSSANEGILTFSTAFDASLTERMRITSAGQTQVVGYDAMTLGFPAVAGGASRSGIKPTVTGAGAGQLQFLVGGDNTTEATTIAAMLDASGNLLVGTTSTINSGLGVFSKANSNQLVINSSNSNGGSLDFCNGGASASARIGGLTTGTATALQVQVGATGGVQLASGATSWTSMSDERLKDIIEPISDAVSKLLTLRTVIGKYKVDAPQVRRVFVIAQDVEKVLPEAVSKSTVSLDDPEEFLGVAYSELIPLLIAGFKEQQATIETLEARIAALES
jgi:hypothetical protein